MTKPSPGQRPGGSVSIVASALKGRAQSVGRLVRPFRPEWGFGVGFPSVLPWAGFGEGRWPADTDHTPRGDGSWEAACSFLNCSRAMNRGEIHHGDTEAQRYKRSVLFLRASVPLWCKPGSWEGLMANELPRIVTMDRDGAAWWQSRPGSAFSVSNNVATTARRRSHFRRGSRSERARSRIVAADPKSNQLRPARAPAASREVCRQRHARPVRPGSEPESPGAETEASSRRPPGPRCNTCPAP